MLRPVAPFTEKCTNFNIGRSSARRHIRDVSDKNPPRNRRSGCCKSLWFRGSCAVSRSGPLLCVALMRLPGVVILAAASRLGIFLPPPSDCLAAVPHLAERLARFDSSPIIETKDGSIGLGLESGGGAMQQTFLRIVGSAVLITASCIVTRRAEALTLGTSTGLRAAVVENGLTDSVAVVCHRPRPGCQPVCSHRHRHYGYGGDPHYAYHDGYPVYPAYGFYGPGFGFELERRWGTGW